VPKLPAVPLPSHVPGPPATRLSRRAQEILLLLASERAARGLRLNELAAVVGMPRSAVGSALSELEAARTVRHRAGATAITRAGRELVEALQAAERPPAGLRRPGAPAPGDAPAAGRGEARIGDRARLQALQDTGLAGPGAVRESAELDRLAALARRWTGVAGALVTLVGHRDLRLAGAALGPTLPEPERVLAVDATPCHRVVLADGELVVADAGADARTAATALVRAGVIGAYLGVPLRTEGGSVIGTLCLVEPRPRAWTEADLGTARTVAAVVQARLRLRALLLRRAG
jgi:alkylated DNA nucleotide flippase Atl1